MTSVRKINCVICETESELKDLTICSTCSYAICIDCSKKIYKCPNCRSVYQLSSKLQEEKVMKFCNCDENPHEYDVRLFQPPISHNLLKDIKVGPITCRKCSYVCKECYRQFHKKESGFDNMFKYNNEYYCKCCIFHKYLQALCIIKYHIIKDYTTFLTKNGIYDIYVGEWCDEDDIPEYYPKYVYFGSDNSDKSIFIQS